MTQRKVNTGWPMNSLKVPLKNLTSQVMVLTGATSGIGLVTARMAADKGVKLVLTARDAEALKELTQELRERGAEAVFVSADISKEEDVEKIAQKAIEVFGGFDTWVNNASSTIFGHLTDIPIEDMRRLFDVNYWGTVYGSRRAVQHFKEKGEPGALINIGSILSNRVSPIQGAYSATKYALKGFTDGLRVEL